MWVKDKRTGDLIRVEELADLTNPFRRVVFGMAQSGEEEQDRAPFAKQQLLFPSGEPLPRCWTDATDLTTEIESARMEAHE